MTARRPRTGRFGTTSTRERCLQSLAAAQMTNISPSSTSQSRRMRRPLQLLGPLQVCVRTCVLPCTPVWARVLRAHHLRARARASRNLPACVRPGAGHSLGGSVVSASAAAAGPVQAPTATVSVDESAPTTTIQVCTSRVPARVSRRVFACGVGRCDRHSGPCHRLRSCRIAPRCRVIGVACQHAALAAAGLTPSDDDSCGCTTARA
jgi:hypothetical protein